jgi:hypothetical protein
MNRRGTRRLNDRDDTSLGHCESSLIRPKLASASLNKPMIAFSKPPFEPTRNSSELSFTLTSRVVSPRAPRVDRHDREAMRKKTSQTRDHAVCPHAGAGVAERSVLRHPLQPLVPQHGSISDGIRRRRDGGVFYRGRTVSGERYRPVTDMMASFPQLLPMLASCFSAIVVPTLLRDAPIYNVLLQRSVLGGSQESPRPWPSSSPTSTKP